MNFKNCINEQCDQLYIGGRTYKIINLVPANMCVKSDAVVEKAIEIGANLDQYEAFHLVDHCNEMPKDLRLKLGLVFVDWQKVKSREFLVYNFAWSINLQRWVGQWDVCGPWACNELYTLMRID